MHLIPFSVPDKITIPATFRGIDPNKALRIYKRGLPHWRQDGATYFVTFRLADSLPAEVEIDTARRCAIWHERISREESRGGGNLSAATRDEWNAFQRETRILLENALDTGAGACWMREHGLRRIVTDCLLHFDRARYELDAFAVMPNHVHVAVRPYEGRSLESILRTWKSYSGRLMNGANGLSGNVWQEESYDRIVRDGDHLRRVVRYIARNPLAAMLGAGEASVWVADAMMAGGGGQVGESAPGWLAFPD